MNGVRFEKQDGMMVSVQDVDDIPEKLVEIFLSVDGFALYADKDEVELTGEETKTLEAGLEKQAEVKEEPLSQAKPQSKRSTRKTTKSGE